MPRFLILVSFVAVSLIAFMTGPLFAAETQAASASKKSKQGQLAPYASLGNAFKAGQKSTSTDTGVSTKSSKSSVKSSRKVGKSKKVASRKPWSSKTSFHKKKASSKSSTVRKSRSLKKSTSQKGPKGNTTTGVRSSGI